MAEQGKEKPRRKPLAKAVEDASPVKPSPCTNAEAYAIKALAAGLASPDQQQRALKWIIEVVAATYDQPYRPGDEMGRRDTDFACGRMYVGKEIVKIVNLAPQALRREEDG